MVIIRYTYDFNHFKLQSSVMSEIPQCHNEDVRAPELCALQLPPRTAAVGAFGGERLCTDISIVYSAQQPPSEQHVLWMVGAFSAF